MIGRRDLLAGSIAAATIASPAAAYAQTRRPRVAVLDWSSPPSERIAVFLAMLAELGPVGGHTVEADIRYAEGRVDLAGQHAAAIVASAPDVIVGFTTPAGAALKRATGSIPLVLATADPVGAGLVSSTARPSDNATGVSSMLTEVGSKHVELLAELVPAAKAIAYVGSRPDPATPRFIAEAESAGGGGGRRIVPVLIDGPGELNDAFAQIASHRLQSAIIQPLFALTDAACARVAEIALRHRVPAITGFAYFARRGGLAAYGSDPHFGAKAAARYVHRILLGARPADLPVEQPRHFHLAVNVKTARALGVTVPQSILIRADEVIE